MFEIIVKKEGMELLGYRKVPVHQEVLGQRARECMPYIAQAFIAGSPRSGNRSAF